MQGFVYKVAIYLSLHPCRRSAELRDSELRYWEDRGFHTEGHNIPLFLRPFTPPRSTPS
jgi:hypothetical protein